MRGGQESIQEQDKKSICKGPELGEDGAFQPTQSLGISFTLHLKLLKIILSQLRRSLKTLRRKKNPSFKMFSLSPITFYVQAYPSIKFQIGSHVSHKDKCFHSIPENRIGMIIPPF